MIKKLMILWSFLLFSSMLNATEVNGQVKVDTQDSMKMYKEGDVIGLQITSLMNEGTYQEMGFVKFDIIIGVNEVLFTSPSTVQARMSEALGSDGSFSLTILRGDEQMIFVYGED